MKKFRLSAVGFLISALCLSASWQESVFAQAAAATTGKVIATGLNSPRGLVVGDDGSIYVAESGTGGDETIPPPPNPRPGTGPTKRGYTGTVTKINLDGSKSIVASNLPSAGGSENDLVGPSGIVSAGGYLWITTGIELIDPSQNKPRLKNDGSVLRVNPNTGEVKLIADITANELTNNPQKNVPHDADSDPYGLTLGTDGNLYVNNAAGNDLYKVNPNTGDFSVVTVFAGLPYPSNQPGNPERGGKNENDPVPTGITTASDGNFYVGLLGGGPPMHGNAKVVRVTPSGAVSDFVTGLTYVTGVTMGPDNLLYVTELTQGLDTSATPPRPLPGQVSRINADGTKTVVAPNLVLSNQAAFDKAGNLYVTTFSAAQPGQGQVVRFDAVAKVAGVPLPNTGVNSETTVTFAQTGYSLSGDFLSYWNMNGGLPVFGFPIDPEREVDGRIFQWFERNRLEKHPENAAPYNVELGLLGVEELSRQGVDWRSLPKVTTAPSGCQYFAATGHSLCGDFLNYWQQHGLKFTNSASNNYSYAESLALFGNPISEPRMETNSSGETVLTQWFERARLEFHPDKSAQYHVLLGRLGAEMFQPGQ